MLLKIIVLIVIVILIFTSYIFYNSIKIKHEKYKSKNLYNNDCKNQLNSFSILDRKSIKNTNSKEFLVDEQIILIEDKCFINCKNLGSIKVEDGNNNYCSRMGVLFSNDLTMIICYPPLKQTSTYFIPQGVQLINTHAFFNNNFIKYAIIPTSLEYIGENAFVNCKNLRQVIIPENVTHIHPRAFNLCPRLIIRCYKNSIADNYCKKYYVPCEYLST